MGGLERQLGRALDADGDARSTVVESTNVFLVEQVIHVELQVGAFWQTGKVQIEPGVEVDASCVACGQVGCPTCKGTGWVEILGAGMVNPAVFEKCGYPAGEYSGFAARANVVAVVDRKSVV